MRRLGWHVVGLAIVVALQLAGATASSAAARFGQEPCGVAGSLPSPAALRPHYALSVQVLPGLRTVRGALTVTFTAPTGEGTDRLVLRLWPNGVRYARAAAHLYVSRVREGNRLLPVSYQNPTTLVVTRPVAVCAAGGASMRLRLA